jgi:hypothetical protein
VDNSFIVFFLDCLDCYDHSHSLFSQPVNAVFSRAELGFWSLFWTFAENAAGPLLTTAEEAQHFCYSVYIRKSPRQYSAIVLLYGEFH